MSQKLLTLIHYDCSSVLFLSANSVPHTDRSMRSKQFWSIIREIFPSIPHLVSTFLITSGSNFRLKWVWVNNLVQLYGFGSIYGSDGFGTGLLIVAFVEAVCRELGRSRLVSMSLWPWLVIMELSYDHDHHHDLVDSNVFVVSLLI